MNRTLLVGAALLFLAACSGAPSTGTTESLVEKQLGGEEQVYVIEGAKKTNGVLLDDIHYEGEYLVTFTFKTSLSDLSKQELAASQGNPIAAMQTHAAIMMLRTMYGDFKAGDQKQINFKAKFLKKEQGWAIEDIDPVL